ncbi:MAG: SpoIID/LytB domain-containing protein [Myxococcota bacterium]|nr:SpoIID/LytB domain-containing protein [Myxococcota bacterium]
MRNWFFILAAAVAWPVGCQPPSPNAKSKLAANSTPLRLSDPERGQDIYHGWVINGLTQAPVPDASVSLMGTSIRAKTGVDGAFRLRTPTGFQWLRTVAEGFDAQRTRLGTPIIVWPKAAPDHAVESYLNERNRPDLDSDDLSDPDLRPQARAWMMRRRNSPNVHDAGRTLGPLKQRIEPPDSIRIYRRGAENDSCLGRVDVIPLEEYVKGVVPHEWIASWTDESLRAGAIAARSYAWGHILGGGKYTCADLDDTTRSQVYKDDRNEKVSRLVDSTRGVGIIRDGAIVTTEYSAENGDPTEFGVSEPLCTGLERRGHGRGMCQWGTQRWSSQRDQTAEWMVAHYFPGATVTDGTPVTSAPSISMSQALARTMDLNCAEPHPSFGCNDFVNQGLSQNIFDAFVGERLRYRVTVQNSGGGPATNLRLGLTTSAGAIAVEAVTIDGLRQELGGQPAAIEVGDLAPNDSRVVEFELAIREALLPHGRYARLQPWIRGIDGVYDKESWAMAPSMNEGQRFNEGDLKLLFEVATYDPQRWTWMNEPADPDHWAGWQPANEETALRAENGLSVSPAMPDDTGAKLAFESPFLPTDLPVTTKIQFRVTNGVNGRLFWRQANASFGDDRSTAFALEAQAVTEVSLDGLRAEQLRLVLESATTFKLLALMDQSSISTDESSPTMSDQIPANESPIGGQPARADFGGESVPAPMVTGDRSSGQLTPPLDDEQGAEEQARESGQVRYVYLEGGCTMGASRSPSTAWLLCGIVLALGLRRAKQTCV